MGEVYVDWKEQIEIEKDYVDDAEGEVERFNLAVATADEAIRQLYGTENVIADKDEAGPDLYRVHGVMLHDPEFLSEIKDLIFSQNVNAEWAVKTIAEKYVQVFESMDNDSLKARADDVKDVSTRVCRLLMHIEGGDTLRNDGRQGLILVCGTLGTSELELMQKGSIAGIVCEQGSIGSHAVIMARNRHKPTVIGLPGIRESLYKGDWLIVDGTSGDVLINPDEETTAKYIRRQEQELLFEKKLTALAGRPAHSADGIPLAIYGNAASDSDIKAIADVQGRGVGLYRTEYTYLTRDHLPSEGEQFWEYKKAVLAMEGRPVTFRTLDIGSDKVPSYLSMPEEHNPALGRRSIRYSLSRTDIFRIQLKAILRASAFGRVAILLPMIATIHELRAAKAIIADVQDELRHEKIDIAPDTPVGVMIETPSAALIADFLAEECDFMSIGSNDLIQYTMAADRLDPALSYLYTSSSPSVLRLIQNVITSGAESNCPVTLCGEMAGEPLMVPVLFGMGLRGYSVNPAEILYTQWILSQLRLGEMRECADDILTLPTEKEIRSYCEKRFSRFTVRVSNDA